MATKQQKSNLILVEGDFEGVRCGEQFPPETSYAKACSYISGRIQLVDPSYLRFVVEGYPEAKEDDTLEKLSKGKGKVKVAVLLGGGADKEGGGKEKSEGGSSEGRESKNTFGKGFLPKLGIGEGDRWVWISRGCLKSIVKVEEGDLSKVTVGDVKTRLENKEGIKAAHQRLIFKGKELSDDENLLDAGFANRSSGCIAKMFLILREGHARERMRQLRLGGTRSQIDFLEKEVQKLEEQIKQVEFDALKLEEKAKKLKDDVGVYGEGAEAGGDKEGLFGRIELAQERLRGIRKDTLDRSRS